LPNVNLSQDSLRGREILGTGTLDQLERLAQRVLDIEDWVVQERDSARYCRLRPETFLAELKSALCFIGLHHRHGFLFLGI
jgi:wobble nucleotide-excising tRNase